MVDFNTLTQKQSSKTIGEVEVKGAHLIGERMFKILQYILSLKTDFGIKLIEFKKEYVKDSEGEELLGCSYPETDSIVISLQKHVDNAYKVCFHDECDMSFSAYLWYNTLRTLLHEVYHIWSRNAADDKMEEIEGEEEMARDWAAETAISMAKTISIEPPSPEAQPFYREELLAFRELLDELDDKDTNLLNQRAMFDNGMVWSNDEMNIFTLKEFCRIASNDGDDPSWNSEEVNIRFVEKGTAEIPPTPDANAEKTEEVTPVATAPKMAVFPKSTIVDSVLEMLEKQRAATETLDLTQNELDDHDDEYIDPEHSYASGSAPAGDPIDALPTETKVSMAFGKLPSPPPSAPIGKLPSPPPSAPPGAATAPTPNTNSDLSMEETTQIVQTVFGRLYSHIFTKCGFQPNLQGEMEFSNPHAILDPVFINDIPNVEKVFKTMDTQDADGKWSPGTPINGSIKGQVFKKSGLPGYVMYLNVGGQIMKRLLIPQNTKTGSRPAIDALNGACIAWVIDGNAATGSQWKAKLQTLPGQVIGMAPYGATTYEAT